MTRTSSDRLRRRAFAIAMAFALGAAPLPLRAEPSAGDFAQARELLNEGLDLREAGDARAALEKMQAANALAHTPITTLELGRTYAALGRLVAARDVLLSVARLPGRPEETERSKAARLESEALVRELRARIPVLALRVVGVAAGAAAVMLDGALLPADALDQPRPVDPGPHSITARAHGTTVGVQANVAEGEARTIDVTFPQVEPPPGSAPAARPGPTAPFAPVPGDPSPSPSRALGAALFGGGVAIAAMGTALMVIEAGKSAEASRQHDRTAYDTAKTGWIAGVAADVVGGVLAASGAVVFLRVGQRASRPPVSLGVRASLDRWTLSCAW